MTAALDGLRSALFSTERAESVTFSPVSGSSITGIRAVRIDDPGDGFKVRPRVLFEVRTSDVPARPLPKDVLTAGDGDWFVKVQPEEARHGRWLVHVERAPRP